MNQVPSKDGQLTRYRAEGASSRRRLVYINGIRTSGVDHAKAALLLSGLLKAEVWGIYNRSDGVLLDLAQCADEYGDLVQDVTLKAGKKGPSIAARAAGFVGGSVLPGLSEAGSVAATLLDMMDLPPATDDLRNPATHRLWRLLAFESAGWPHGVLSIVAHSQGNLIASSALHMYLYWRRRTRAAGGRPAIHVHSLASPAPAWPRDALLTIRTYSHGDDFVTWLSLGRSYHGVVTASHAGSMNPIAPHDAGRYFRNSSFQRDIAADLGIVRA
jgi:hypothetical protein